MFGKIKAYLMGVVTGTILVSGVGFAQGDILEDGFFKVSKMVCSIWANGEEVKMDLPVLNYEGRSYVPMRKLAELTGAEVTWNGVNGTIHVDSTIKKVIKEVPKEIIKEVVKEVPVEVIKEVIKEIPKEIIKEVPIEIIKEVPVEKIVYVYVPSTTTITQSNTTDYNYELKKINDKYEIMRQNAQSNIALAKKNYLESLANKGLSTSGASNQADITFNNMLQKELTSINTQEQNDINSLKIKYNIQ